MSKKSFVMYTTWAQMIAEMPDEQAGVLIKAISCYALGREYTIEDPVLSAVFTMIKDKLDDDRVKYDEKVERITKNRQNRNQTDISMKSDRNQNDIGSVTVTDTVTVINNNTVNKENRRFTPPTVEDVKAYIREQGYNVDANAFISYYESNGWKVGKNSMKSWKAAVRTWASRDKGRTNQFHNFNERDNAGVGKALWQKQIAMI